MTDTATSTGGRAPGNGNSYNPTCGEGFPRGTPVTPSDDGVVSKARANSADTSLVSGLAAVTGVEGQSALVQFGGVLTLEASEWDVVTGDSGGLTTNSAYYLSSGSPAGQLTTTRPTAGGTFATPVGIALSPTDMLLQLGVAVDNS